MRRRRFRRSGKRSVSWLDGVSTYDSVAGTDTRTITMAPLTTAPNLWGAVIGLAVGSDLPDHGGEDAVLTRVVGRLAAYAGRRNAGAGFAVYGFQLRVVLLVGDQLPAGGVTPFDLTSSAGMGQDDILFMRDIIVTSTPVGTPFTGFDAQIPNTQWTEFNVKAKRKLQKDHVALLWFQTSAPAGTVGLDFQLVGGLRSLLMRPR